MEEKPGMIWRWMRADYWSEKHSKKQKDGHEHPKQCREISQPNVGIKKDAKKKEEKALTVKIREMDKPHKVNEQRKFYAAVNKMKKGSQQITNECRDMNGENMWRTSTKKMGRAFPRITEWRCSHWPNRERKHIVKRQEQNTRKRQFNWSAVEICRWSCWIHDAEDPHHLGERQDAC